MKKNVSFFVLMFLIFLSPQIIFAQTGTDPDPVQSAKNRKANEEREKLKASDAPINGSTPAPPGSKSRPVTTSSPSTVVVTPPSNPSKRKFIDPANMDLSVKPGDNFYLYANGAWLKKTPIPQSKTSWGSYNVLIEESSQALKNLLEEAANDAGAAVGDRDKSKASKTDLMKRVGDYYASAMDSAAIEKLGYKPIKSYLDAITALSSKTQVLKQVNSLRSQSITSPLYRIGVGQDAKDVSKYIISIGQGGTTLPDRDYYLKTDARSQKIRTDYAAYITKLFTLTGETSVKAMANAVTIMQLETAMAQAQMSRVEMRDPTKLYNKFTVADLSAKTPNLNWATILPELGYKGNPENVIVSNPKYMMFIDSLLNKVSLDDWKVYLKWVY